jgi:hypothetical protein
MNEKKRRGRPLGHKLSDESRKKIALSKIGKKHSLQTKMKISSSVKEYWFNKNKETTLQS